MALEIPAIVPDRPPLPNWGQGAAPVRVPVPADRLLAILQDLSQTLPQAALAALRGAAATGANVDIVLGSDKMPAQILLGGQRIALPAAARDAVLALVGPEGGGAPASATPQGVAMPLPADTATAARAALVGAQVAELRNLPLPAAGAQGQGPTSGLVLGESPYPQGEARPQPVAVRQPLIAANSPAALRTGEIARSLAQTVDTSGLFLESHAAQWTQGIRPLQQLQAEAQAIAAAPPFASAQTVQSAADQRAAAQIDALQQQAVALAGQAWAGQEFRLEIARDPARKRGALDPGGETGLFTATLAMELPNLGAIHARIRVMESTVGVRLESEDPGALRAGLDALAAALDARGLTVAQLTAGLPEPEPC